MRANGIAAIVKTKGARNEVLVVRWNGCDDVQVDILAKSTWFRETERDFRFSELDCVDGMGNVYSETWK